MNQNHYTEEQLAQGVKALEFCRNSAVPLSDETIAGLVYDHMIAAAPQPPAGQQDSNHVPDSTKKVTDIPDAGNMIQGGQQGMAEAEGQPFGWVISYKLTGYDREVFCRHNSVGDYRHFDPRATSTPVFVDPATAGESPWDANQIKQPGWHHVAAGFIEGAREARANPEATDADFKRAADGYSKRVFEEVDPESERRLRTGEFTLPAGEATAAQGADWISVDERLPDRTDRYIVHLNTQDTGWLEAGWVALFMNGYWSDCDAIEDGCEVTHWMHFPAAPSPAAPGNGEGGK